MKYGYVYTAVCAVIVAIGIIMIFQIESNQSEQSNRTTILLFPNLTEDQAFQIVKSDLSKKVYNLDYLQLYQRDPHNPNRDLPLPLVYFHPNGTQFFIDGINHEIKGKCTNKQDIHCSIPQNWVDNNPRRLVYLFDLLWQAKNGSSAPDDYLVDAETGDIVFSFMKR